MIPGINTAQSGWSRMVSHPHPIAPGPETEAVLTLAGVTVEMGSTTVVDNVSASIPRGAMVAVVGPNGAGKSTLFRAISGLLPLKSGTVTLRGASAPTSGHCIAYVPQREEVDWRFPVTVLDVVLMGTYPSLGWVRRPGRRDRAFALECLDQMDMAGLASRSIRELSGGQQQRVFLARALAQSPCLLLLDEPFAGVDVTSQEIAVQALRRLGRDGVTSLVSTHDIALAADKFDLVLLLNRRLLAFGPPGAVLGQETLAATFGASVLIYREGQSIIAVADDHCGHDHTSGVGALDLKAAGLD
jgi:ABC-type Mn2+/Zn2+ transport system ATPase subunit